MPRELSPLFDPASVAVVGASDDPAKYGHAIAVQALRADGRRPLHLVNRRGGNVLGRTAATSLGAIGEPVELVVVSVPLPGFEDAVDEALACGARAIVAITAGFAELGPEGLARQRAVAEKVRQAGALLVGPNCLGVADNTTELYLASDRFAHGGVALLSQSGNLALELGLRLEPQGLGFSRFVSLGNQADVTLVDLVEDCARHDGTRAIAVYAEDFGDGRAFAEAAARAGKPVVLLTAGRGDASARSAKSHTGALTTSSDVVLAACRDAGIELTRTPRELACVLGALDAGRRARGRRVAVFTDGGGHGAIAADAVEAAGLSVPELSASLQGELSGRLWEQSAVGNPVDLAGMGEQDPASYADTVQALLDSDEVDAVLLTGYFGGYAAAEGGLGGGAGGSDGADGGQGADGAGLANGGDTAHGAHSSDGAGGADGGHGAGGAGVANGGDTAHGAHGRGGGHGPHGAEGPGSGLSALGAAELAAARAIAAAVPASGKPLVVQSMYPGSVSCRALAAVGVPVHEAVEDAARAPP
ncbi:CoA-binding protein, partial [Streptacidiphilus pinicola]